MARKFLNGVSTNSFQLGTSATSGQVLTTDASGNGTWQAGGTGDVVGPGGAVDTGIAVYDGTTGKLVKDSGLVVTNQSSTVKVVENKNGYLKLASTNHPVLLSVDDGSGSFTTAADFSSTTANIYAPLSLNSNKISSVTDPTLAQDAATKNYVDTTALPNPMTTSGDTIYGGTAGAATRLAGNTTTTKKFMTQTGTGSASAAPAWGTIAATDVPTLNQNTTGSAATLTTGRTIQTNLASTSSATFNGSANITPGVTGTLPIANGGTGSTTAAALAITVGNLLMPVGFLYTSTSSTNPGTALGFGTWSAYGQGQVLVGKAASGTFATAGSTGGEETHVLTTAEMPSHSHSTTAKAYLGEQTWDGASAFGGGTIHLNGITPANTGGGGAHNNLQPYVVVYIWQRTA